MGAMGAKDANGAGDARPSDAYAPVAPHAPLAPYAPLPRHLHRTRSISVHDPHLLPARSIALESDPLPVGEPGRRLVEVWGAVWIEAGRGTRLHVNDPDVGGVFGRRLPVVPPRLNGKLRPVGRPGGPLRTPFLCRKACQLPLSAPVRVHHPDLELA